MPTPQLTPLEKVFDDHFQSSSADFWRRFGGQPDVRGKRVLDFGCSTGGMVHRLMQAGAASVIGIDLSERATGYARDRLKAEWGDRVDIRCEDVRKASFAPVDIIVSQNTMEHVMPLGETLNAVAGHCKPGGEMYFGFSPLWHSPYGHHGYPRTKLPWLHLFRGDAVVLDSFRERVGRDYTSIEDAGFNRATPAEFRSAFEALPAEIVSFRRNVGGSPLRTFASQTLLAPARLPALEKYLTVGMYWHLRKFPQADESMK